MLEDIKGIGPQNLLLLKKLNISNVDELINYYPFRYNIIENTSLDSEKVVVSAIIESNPITSYIKRNFNKLSFRALVSNKLINVSIFNRAFLKNNIVPGRCVTLIGTYDEKKNQLTCADIKFKEIVGSMIEPVYHTTTKLSSKVLNNLILNALNSSREFIDYIPEEFVSKYDFIDKEKALRLVHNPLDEKLLIEAQTRLKYEELFKFMFKINYLKTVTKDSEGIKRIIDKNKINEFINNLPFELTSDQLKCINEVYEDLVSKKRMNRLVLGDVGSGKTIVAIVSMLMNFYSGYQSAMLVPTEILANQHFLTVSKLLKDYHINIAILTGSLNKTAKKNIEKQLANNEIDILIATHAVLESNIEFNNLGLVITDEQHRFGVNQRKVFQNKGIKCDIMYMSATPIPRTYALTLYGDMDISLIKTKPKGRKEIITKTYTFKEIKEVLSIILDEIKKSHQAYIVCSMIESDEESELLAVKSLKEKIDIAYNNKIPTDILHGKLKSNEKDEIMDKFKSGETKILISTTVIEVGVDVPNASIMAIFNAERFGLATLHQLRGRIGRGDIESKCLLISDKKCERLKVLEESNDGFYISEMDFKLRGEGDLFGVKQSGDMSFNLADIRRDSKLLIDASKDAKEFIDENIDNNFQFYKHYQILKDNLTHID